MVAILVSACAASVQVSQVTRPTPAPSPTAIPLGTTLPVNLSHDDVMRLLEYDHSISMDYREEVVSIDGTAILHRFNYRDMVGKRDRGTLVIPQGSGPFGAVMFLAGGTNGKAEYLPDAVELSKHGIASLLLDYPELYPVPVTDAEAVSDTIFEMREFRRLFDWLANRPEVDSNRLGLVGVSYGAVRAGMFAGVEGGRLRLAVLNSTPESYHYPAMAAFDPITWAPYVSPCALYVQEGTRDTWFTRSDAESLIAAAREPKRLLWYDADHGLNDQAYNDYMGWVTEALGKAGG